VEPVQYIDALEREGNRLADTADAIDVAAPVPTCPDWTLRDLLRHIGGVHRWAGEHIRDRLPRILQVDDFRDLVGEWPDDAALVDWYRGELQLLLDTFRAAPRDIDCAQFLKSPDPLTFWTRRQAHEATIHRADVETIVGRLTPVDTEFALDGIDELVDGFVPRPFMKLRSEEPRTLAIAPDDGDRTWVLTISEGPVTVSTGRSEADCTVGGNASDIYFALWNRADGLRLAIDGRRDVFDLFRTKITIKWS